MRSSVSVLLQGVRKAAFNAFKMLNYLGPQRLMSGGGTGGDGVDAMATTSASGDEVQILVYNYFVSFDVATAPTPAELLALVDAADA